MAIRVTNNYLRNRSRALATLEGPVHLAGTADTEE